MLLLKMGPEVPSRARRALPALRRSKNEDGRRPSECSRDLNPRMGREHFIIKVWSLFNNVVLLSINNGDAYLITLMIKELVNINFALNLQYLNMLLSIDNLKFTLLMILLTVLLLERHAVIYTPSTFILLTCSIL